MKHAIKKANSINNASFRFFGFQNGNTNKKIKKFIEDYNIDISHFDKQKLNRKWERIDKECPVCETKFTILKGHPRAKVTCGLSCANTYFRSGEDHPNWKESAYVSTCFAYHEKKCIICKEYKIIEVHHFDENNKNNKPENLIPLCPTHHKYWHSRYKELVYDKVIKYRKKFIERQCRW